MNRIPILAVVLVAIGLGSLVVTLAYTAYDAMSYPNYGLQVAGSQGMMGRGWNGMGGMMGNGMMGGGNGMMGGGMMGMMMGHGMMGGGMMGNGMMDNGMRGNGMMGNGMTGNGMMGGGMIGGGSRGNMGNGMMGGGGMIGNGMMGSGMTNAPVSSIDNQTFNSINLPPAGVTVNRVGNSITITTSGVTVPIEGSPLWYPPQPGDFWLVYGLVNPTIYVKQGVTVRFLFINMDNETHVPSITTLGPRYSYMPMMDGMMGSTGQRNVDWLGIGPMLPGVSDPADTVYIDSTLSVTFNNPGNFWYLCLYPGHAQNGMYGEIQVVS